MSFDECERRLPAPAKIPPGEALPPITQKTARTPTELPAIPLSDEHRRILEQPVDSRVERILSEIEEERKEMAGAVKSRGIIRFPFNGSAAGHAIRDSDGNWTIVPEPLAKSDGSQW